METACKRALIANISNHEALELNKLLQNAGFKSEACVTNGAQAIDMIGKFQPDLLLADAILPGMDGISLTEKVFSMPLLVHPMIILMKLPGCLLPGTARLRGLCAAILEKPLEASALADTFAQLLNDACLLPPKKAARLKSLLKLLGVPEHPGRDDLTCAIGLAWMDRRHLRSLKKDLYPTVAARFGKTPVQVERAIRHVIDVAWRTGEIDQQHQIFGDTIDARRGRPTCGEMIAQLADILRWEGRQ